MPRDYRLYLEDILEAIGSIREYTAGMDYEASSRDRKTQDAVIRNLEVIGEAAERIPESVLAAALKKSNGAKSSAFAISSFTSISGSAFRLSGTW
jgi:hypothetical protein